MRRLKAREYKLLLDFSRFPSAMTAARANAFWRRHVARVIDHVLDTKKGGGSRTKGEFKAPVTRRVTFWDTEEGLLAAHDYALRERADDPADASPRSLLLKLRTPDMFISGAGNLAGKADDQSVFEEDIAPLEARATGKARPSVVLASPPSMRSRFSLSLGVTCKRAEFTDYGGLSRLFPGLARDLRAQGARALAKARLHHGPVITETVFDGAEVKLGGDVTGKFSLSFWEFAHGRPVPGVAEISYKCRAVEGVVPLDAARRAYVLFTGLQQELGDRLNLRYSSKTELALPSRKEP